MAAPLMTSRRTVGGGSSDDDVAPEEVIRLIDGSSLDFFFLVQRGADTGLQRLPPPLQPPRTIGSCWARSE